MGSYQQLLQAVSFQMLLKVDLLNMSDAQTKLTKQEKFPIAQHVSAAQT